MMPWQYSVPATDEEVDALFADLAPQAKEELPSVIDAAYFKAAKSRAEFSLALRLGGSLCGIALVHKGTLAFLETRFLVKEHCHAYARGTSELLAATSRIYGGDLRVPVPQKKKGEEWFRRCGLVRSGDWMIFKYTPRKEA